MRMVGTILAIAAAMGAAADDKTKVLLIATAHDHPWATHMYREGCEIIAAGLNQNEGVEAVVSPEYGWPADPSLLEDIDVLALYTSAGGDVALAPERAEAFRALMARGVGFAAVHWSTATNDAALGPEYLSILGGWFHFDHSGLDVSDKPLVALNPEHPVLRGWTPYLIHDEFYLDLKFAPEAKPLLKVDVAGKEQVVAWAYERPGGGRSFGTTLAHFHRNFQAEGLRRLIVNGILWAANADVPEGGADVTVEAAALAIPEAPSAEK